jgi:tetratricopeptide (TPR) repeat protein
MITQTYQQPIILGRFKILALILILGAALSGGDLLAQESNLNEIYRQGNELVKAGKWAEAAEVYRKGIERYPKEAWLYVNLGWAYRNLKEYPKALEVTLKGYELRPDDENIKLNLKGAYFDLGNFHLNNRDWQRGADVHLEALKHFPDEGWLYSNLGWAYRNLGKFEMGLEVTLKGYELRPGEKIIQENLKGAYYDLGKLYLDNKEWEKGRDLYLAALTKFPDEAWFHGNLAWVYRNLGDKAKGLDVAKRAYQLKGDDDKIKENLKWAYIDLGNYYRLEEKNPAKSISLYQEALKLLPDDPLIYDRLGWAYIFSQRREEALKGGYFEKSTQLYLAKNKTQQKVALSLPFSGRWQVSQGNSGSWSHIGLGSFAWDFMKVDEKYQTHGEVRGRKLTNEDFFAFGSEVLAPAPGVVTEVGEGVDDNPYEEWNYHSIGNYVLIDHGDGTVSGLYHFRKGSIVVKVGDRVERGQVLGLVGNSGYSDVPHLHYNLSDGSGATIPAAFSDYVRRDKAGREDRVSKGVPLEGEVVWRGD